MYICIYSKYSADSMPTKQYIHTNRHTNIHLIPSHPLHPIHRIQHIPPSSHPHPTHSLPPTPPPPPRTCTLIDQTKVGNVSTVQALQSPSTGSRNNSKISPEAGTIPPSDHVLCCTICTIRSTCHTLRHAVPPPTRLRPRPCAVECSQALSTAVALHRTCRAWRTHAKSIWISGGRILLVLFCPACLSCRLDSLPFHTLSLLQALTMNMHNQRA